MYWQQSSTAKVPLFFQKFFKKSAVAKVKVEILLSGFSSFVNLGYKLFRKSIKVNKTFPENY